MADNGHGLEFPCHDTFDPRPLDPRTDFSPNHKGTVRLSDELTVASHPVEHGVPCLAYRLQRTTAPRFSLETALSLGLQPGPWVGSLLAGRPVTQIVQGEPRDAEWLASRLLSAPVTHSLGFLTDTRLNEGLVGKLTEFFADVDALCCETAYLDEEAHLAAQNLHMTTRQAANLAVRCRALRLLIFHLSRRHCETGTENHLAEVRQVFPDADLLWSANRAASESPS